MEEELHNNDEEQNEIPVGGSEEAAAAPDETDETEASAASEAPTGTEPEAPEKDPLDVALDEIASLKDKYLRQVAEFDNFRKRTLKERTELILNGSEKAVTQLLPIIDDMERALKSGQNEEDPQVLRDGMEMIYHKTMKMLEGLGVQKIDTNDADFSTDLHEAVAMVPGQDDKKKGKVIDCLTTGYKLNDKVIRHAKVAVGA